MKKIMTIVGARPQFIKAAPVSRAFSKRFEEVLVHTGQHYDDAMSERFFREMGIPEPKYNLNVGSGGHGYQTGKMLIGLEELINRELPDAVLVYGDTNSTLAGALAAVKLGIPVFHVESGLRSYNRQMPEEHNRVLTDHMSELLFCPTPIAIRNLENEGVRKGVSMVGDVMADAVHLFEGRTNEKQVEQLLLEYFEGSDAVQNILQNGYYLSTIHRAENTNCIERLDRIFEFLRRTNNVVLFPAHPRIRRLIDAYRGANILFLEPQGYLMMLALIKGSLGVITDSGGLQKEAYLLRKKCITLRSETEWKETLENGWNVLVNPDIDSASDYLDALSAIPGPYVGLFGDGKASVRICDEIERWFGIA